MKNKIFGEVELEWLEPEEYYDSDWMYLCNSYEWVNGYEQVGEVYTIVVKPITNELRYTLPDLI